MKTSLAQSELQARLSTIEPLLNAIAVFILATIFLFWDGSRAAYLLLALAALVFVIKYRPQLPSDQRLYAWPIIAYFGASALSVLANGLPESGVNSLGSRSLLLLMAIPLVSIFYLSFNSERNAWIKFAVACMVLGAQALIDTQILNEARADGGHNSAAFGFTALAMTSVMIASYYRFSQIRFGKVIYFLALLMGICAMILSGTRTSWLAGFAVVVIAMIFYLNRYSFLKRALIAITLLTGILIVGSSLPIVQKRVDQMIEMVSPYVKGEEQTEFNSLRKRVELWKLGWQMGMENKIFGLGHSRIKQEINEYVAKAPHLKGLGTKSHLHNQFMQTFAMSGLVGLFSFVALLICHFWIFTKYLGKQYSMQVRCFALAGLLLMVAYLLKSVPGVPFYGKQYLVIYGFVSAEIWGSLLGALRESDRTGAFIAPQASNEPV
jgi:O-antigen ligase